MTEMVEQAILDFYTYPPIGDDDWRYTFQTAQIRVLEMQMPIPFSPGVVRDFARGLEEVMVVEEMNPTWEELLPLLTDNEIERLPEQLSAKGWTS